MIGQLSSTSVLLADVLADTRIAFDIGNDGLPYAVFPDSSYSWEYNAEAPGYGIACFGNFENAVLLQPTLGL